MKATATKSTPTGLQWVRRERSSLGLRIAVPVVAVLSALVVGAILLALVGQNPIAVYVAMFQGAFGSANNLAETLVKTIPLMLTGLGVSIAFRMLLWNIGAEGQLHFGAIFATGAALYVVPNAPAPLMIPLLVVAGFMGGALWGLVPGFLRAYLKVSETITTLMLNYIAIGFAEYLVYGPWKNPEGFGFPGTRPLPDAAWLPRLGTTRVHLRSGDRTHRCGDPGRGVSPLDLGLRDSGDWRERTCRTVCWHQYPAQYPAGDGGQRRTGGHRGHERSHRYRPPVATQPVAGLRLHRDHRSMAGAAQPRRDCGGGVPVRRVCWWVATNSRSAWDCLPPSRRCCKARFYSFCWRARASHAIAW